MSLAEVVCNARFTQVNLNRIADQEPTPDMIYLMLATLGDVICKSAALAQFSRSINCIQKYLRDNPFLRRDDGASDELRDRTISRMIYTWLGLLSQEGMNVVAKKAVGADEQTVRMFKRLAQNSLKSSRSAFDEIANVMNIHTFSDVDEYLETPTNGRAETAFKGMLMEMKTDIDLRNYFFAKTEREPEKHAYTRNDSATVRALCTRISMAILSVSNSMTQAQKCELMQSVETFFMSLLKHALNMSTRGEVESDERGIIMKLAQTLWMSGFFGNPYEQITSKRKNVKYVIQEGNTTIYPEEEHPESIDAKNPIYEPLLAVYQSLFTISRHSKQERASEMFESAELSMEEFTDFFSPDETIDVFKDRIMRFAEFVDKNRRDTKEIM